MRAAASALIVLALVAVVVYVALRGPDYEAVQYVPHTSTSTAVLSGRAVDAAGKPVADVALTWFSAVESRGGTFGGTSFRGDETGVRTGADGTFRLAGLRGDEGYLGVGSSDTLREGETGRVRLRAGFEATELELVVADVPAARRLQGTLLKADGAPAASVTIHARCESWRGTWKQVATTDTSGAFELAAPCGGGECELWELRPDGSEEPLGTLPVGTGGHVLRLP